MKLFDFAKLNDVSKNVISRLDAKTVTEKVTEWALQFDEPFGKALEATPDFAEKIFGVYFFRCVLKFFFGSADYHDLSTCLYKASCYRLADAAAAAEDKNVFIS